MMELLSSNLIQNLLFSRVKRTPKNIVPWPGNKPSKASWKSTSVSIDGGHHFDLVSEYGPCLNAVVSVCATLPLKTGNTSNFEILQHSSFQAFVQPSYHPVKVLDDVKKATPACLSA